MAKPNENKWPGLFKYWNEYGHSIEWSKLFDMKARSDGCYVVLAWKHEDGTVEVADVAAPKPDEGWEMQNDGGNEMTIQQWRKLRIVPECDWYTVLGG